jgi:hypothetical protein
MVIADGAYKDRSVFLGAHGYSSTSRHVKGNIQNVLYFDAHVATLKQYDFWPYFRYSGSYNMWCTSALWWPIETSYPGRANPPVW